MSFGLLRFLRCDKAGEGAGREGAAQEFLKYPIQERQCVGDFLWLPRCLSQEMDYDDLTEAERKLFQIRPVTLFQLRHIRERIRDRQMRVVMAIGHCQTCLKDKADILGHVLRLSQQGKGGPLITHVVADIRSVAKLLNPDSH